MKYVVMINFVSQAGLEPRMARIFDNVKAAKQAAYNFIDQDRARVNGRPDSPTTPVYQISPHDLIADKAQKGIYRVDLLEWVNQRSSIVETAVVCPVE